ncbi:CBS domain-containing protein [Bailinhaonella thermotolerans]|uniref:CBS domain-containing protein n=1 Tax=Bailinhaonella thermotolerans TaxID=1070861 RepID=A0A3A4A4K8_9ACTN|nr:CBS domain-containing protein [Bailinhaonella thermotolerans]RJL22721.1 CBS domain-containing protein [Bailinhaonella thermotolerans]
MVQVIDHEGVRELAGTRGAALVEVLPRAEYDWAHLPGAVNIPLGELDAAAADRLDRSRPVVVYCHDLLCDMSPRGAARLRALGFGEVYDYRLSKMDWLAAGLPYEGHARLVAGVARRDPVVASPGDPLDEVASRALEDAAGVAVVVDGEGVVQGLVGEEEVAGARPGATAGDVMRLGVLTVRPSEELDSALRRMERKGLKELVVSGVDGRLTGILVAGAVRSPGWESDNP